MMRRIGARLLAAGAVLNAAAQAQAQWEVEVGRFILSRRKRVLLLASLPILAALGLGLACADTIPSRIPTLGGSRAYIPAFVTPQIFYGSILGVFLLAMVKRASATGAFVGLIAGMSAVAVVSFGAPSVSFLWHNVIGAVTVVGVGMVLSAGRPATATS